MKSGPGFVQFYYVRQRSDLIDVNAKNVYLKNMSNTFCEECQMLSEVCNSGASVQSVGLESGVGLDGYRSDYSLELALLHRLSMF